MHFFQRPPRVAAHLLGVRGHLFRRAGDLHVPDASPAFRPEARVYRLGNRSALEWVLDQYKEEKRKDPTIREKFDTFRFADHKERVIELLARVARVSVETMRIVDQLKQWSR